MPQGETKLHWNSRKTSQIYCLAQSRRTSDSNRVRELKKRRKKVHNIDYRKKCTIDNKMGAWMTAMSRRTFELNEIVSKPFKLSDDETDLFKVNWPWFYRREFFDKQQQQKQVENLSKALFDNIHWSPPQANTFSLDASIFQQSNSELLLFSSSSPQFFSIPLSAL